MDVVDNRILLVIARAMDAPLDSPLSWGNLAVASMVAGIAVVAVNRRLISRVRRPSWGSGHKSVSHTRTREPLRFPRNLDRSD
jgi:hypothetical protein